VCSSTAYDRAAGDAGRERCSAGCGTLRLTRIVLGRCRKHAAASLPSRFVVFVPPTRQKLSCMLRPLVCVLLFPCTSVMACSTHGYHAPSLPFQNVTSLVWPIEAVICCDVCCPRRSVVDHCDSFAVCFVVSCLCTPPCGSFVPRSSERVSPKGVWPAHRFVCSRRGSHYVS